MTNKLILACLVGTSLLTLNACVGRRAKAEVATTVKTTTVGQELTDLQAALDSGVIDQKEYDKKKKQILNDQ